MRLCNLITLLGALVATPTLFAEVASVSGTVRDEKDRPVQGAQVLLVNRDHNERVNGQTNAKGDYQISLRGLGWQAGPGYLLTVSAPSHDLKVTRTIALKDGANAQPKLHLDVAFQPPPPGPHKVAEHKAPAVPMDPYPLDNPGWYVGGMGGMVRVERDPIKFGRTTDAGAGPNDVKLDPSKWEVAYGGTVGFQFNTNQAVEVSYFGTSIDASGSTHAMAYNIPVIDPSTQLIGPLGEGDTVFNQRYKAEWNDLNLMYVHRFLDCHNWTLIGRGGVAGGTFDQEFSSHVQSDGAPISDLKETVDDLYVGPQVGIEGQYRFCKHFWTTLGMDLGGMFGSADMRARQDLQGFDLFGTDRMDVKDSLDYAALRLGAMVSIGWAPCRWASLEVGYHFGFWSDVPSIDNPGVTADLGTGTMPYGSKAHLGTEALETHAVTGTVTFRFP